MSKRNEIYLLVGLLVVAAVAYFFSRTEAPSAKGVLAADTSFHPLNVDEPQLRLDLLEKIKKLEYSGSHRNIFTFGPPPPAPKTLAQIADERRHSFPTVPVPPPPAPVTVPAQLFGYASMPDSGKRVAFFLDGDDVLVVEEGSVFLNRFRLDKIGNDSADVEEISSGRHATVQMVPPVSGEAPTSSLNQ